MESPERDVEFDNLLREAQEAAAAGDGKKIGDLALAMLARATQWAIEHPTPEQEIGERARACEEQGDWTEAEKARQEILALALEKNNPGYPAKAHWDLAAHYTARGLIDQSLIQTQAAVECARKSEIPTLVHMALERHSKTLLLKGAVHEAFRAIEECLTLLPNELLTANNRARALILRAECMALLKNFDHAEANLREAVQLLTPADPDAAMPGAKSGMALWWRASSILCAQKDDWTGAVKAAEQEVALRREALSITGLVGINSLNSQAQALASLEICCRKTGAIDNAEAAAAESDQIRATLHLAPLDRSRLTHPKA